MTHSWKHRIESTVSFQWKTLQVSEFWWSENFWILSFIFDIWDFDEIVSRRKVLFRDVVYSVLLREIYEALFVSNVKKLCITRKFIVCWNVFGYSENIYFGERTFGATKCAKFVLCAIRSEHKQRETSEKALCRHGNDAEGKGNVASNQNLSQYFGFLHAPVPPCSNGFWWKGGWILRRISDVYGCDRGNKRCLMVWSDDVYLKREICEVTATICVFSQRFSPTEDAGKVSTIQKIDSDDDVPWSTWWSTTNPMRYASLRYPSDFLIESWRISGLLLGLY